MQKEMSVGGQAVIEGVMMRSPNYLSTSVRKKGKIISRTKKIKKRNRFLKLPVIRGIVNFLDMLVMGIKELTWSANQQTDEKDEKLTKKEIIATIAFSLTLVLVIFVALPYFLTHLAGFAEETQPIIFNLVDGAIKIGLFLIYLYAISFMKDIKTLFKYHGAEHKVVHCYEEKKPLTVENAKKFSTKHPRCGTSFIFIVFIISILLFSLIPVILNSINPNFGSLALLQRKAILFMIRVLVIPIIAGLSYELLKLSAKHKNNKLIKMATLPGLWLQKITTKEPTDKQIEIAIASLKNVLKREKIKF